MKRIFLLGFLLLVIAACSPTTAPTPTARPPTAEPTTAPTVEETEVATEEATEVAATEVATEAVVEETEVVATEVATEAVIAEETEVATEEATEVAAVTVAEVTEAATEEATEIATEAATEVAVVEAATEVATEEATEVATEAATEVAVVEAATEVATEEATEVAATIELTAEVTEEATEAATAEATIEATLEATLEPTASPEATQSPDAVSASIPDLGGREVTIAVENAYPPYNMINEEGVGVGWDYDTFRDLCYLLNCVPVFVETAWDGMLLAIAQGDIDVAGDGITYTAERAETVDFSTLYQSYDETLLVRADEDRFSTVEELLALPDFLVATQIGTTNEITAHNLFAAENVRSYDQFPAAVQALLNEDVDAVVVDRPAAEGFITTQGGMKTLEESLSGQQGLAFAFPPGSDLVEPFNAAKAYLEETGRWEQIYVRWFAQPELPDLEGREVTIAVENAYPPYNYIDTEGNAVGWDYDTFREICRRLNCTPVFLETAWDGMLLAIAQGDIDVAADGITYTAERDETVDFSSLYQSYDETLLVRADEDRFSTVAELLALPDFLVATQIGTTNEITAHNLFEAENVRSYDQFPAAVQALLNGDVDAVVVDRPAAEGFITTQGGLKTLEESLSGQQGLAFAFPPGSDLVEPINQAKAAMEADGTWDDIFWRWFGRD